MNIELTITGTSPLLMHNPRMVDPDFELNRLMKPISAKRKKTEEDLREMARLEWYGGLYEIDGVVTQPTSKVRKCIVETGRMFKQGKALERALSFVDKDVPLSYDGPEDIHALYADDRFHSRLSVRVGNSRVMRVRPKFFPWSLTVRGLLITDIGINFSDLCQIADLAGVATGIGDNRVNGYGRFSCKVKEVSG